MEPGLGNTSDISDLDLSRQGDLLAGGFRLPHPSIPAYSEESKK